MDDASVRTGPSTAQLKTYTILVLLVLATVATIVAFRFAGRTWGGGVIFAFLLIIIFKYNSARTSTVSLQQANSRVGLSQVDIVDAIPAFQYRAADADAASGGGGSGTAAAASVEECAVCIGVLRDGETVRRLPACGHAFHALCIDRWLRGHTTCPICRAGVKVVVAGDGEPSPVAAAV